METGASAKERGDAADQADDLKTAGGIAAQARSSFGSALARCSPSLLAAVVAVGVYIYWGQFHEINRWYGAILVLPEGLLQLNPALGGFLNCALRPLGIIAGCVVVAFAKRKDRQLNAQVARMMLVPLALLALASYGLAAASSSWLFVLSCSFFGSLLAVYPVLYLFLSIADLGKRTVLFTTIASLVGSKLFGVLVMPAALHLGGAWAAFIAQAAPLACAFLLWNRAELHPMAPGPTGDTENLDQVKRRARRPLLAHLVFYGFGLGLFHAMLGVGFNLGGSLRTVVDFAGVLLASAVAATILQKLSFEEDLWQNIRGVVFPSAIIGFLLIPISSVYVVSAVLEEFSLSYYTILFTLGCLLMMRNTVLEPLTVATAGLLFKSLGSFVGIALGTALSLNSVATNLQAICITTAVVFSAFTLGTFWVGKDSDLRKWWGLRRNYTAQRFRDQLLEQKAAKLAAEHGLSNREQEILVKLAQGKRAQQICDECYISIYTVRGHTQKIYRKLGVHSFTELDALLSAMEPDE